MKFKLSTNLSKKHYYLLALALPAISLGLLYLAVIFYPPATGSLLTVDLGQQYVDFFAAYKKAFTTDPWSFFYSFSKSIGGDMVGLWAYYLTSPLNLVLLLFPTSAIGQVASLLIWIKMVLASFCMAIYLAKSYPDSLSPRLLVYAYSYGLMAYLFANQLNLMWLDGIFLLPLVLLSMEEYLKQGRPLAYVLLLALAVFANYYVGYMICLFIVLVSPYYLYLHFGFNWKPALKKLLGLALWSILAMGLIAFLLLPTFYSLIGGKGANSSLSWSWKYSYSPQLLLSKFYLGSFDFDQMPSGYPNLFIGSAGLFSFLAYYTSSKIKRWEKLISLPITMILFLSLLLPGLDKVWHGGQFPVWYPYRFSFLVCFWMIFLGARYGHMLRSEKKSLFLFLLPALASSIYFFIYPLSYLQPLQIVLGFLAFGLALFLYYRKANWLLLSLSLVELLAGGAIILSRLGYVPIDQYQAGVATLQTWARDQKEAAPFARTEKNFYRSKDDALQVSTRSITHFASTLEQEIPHLFGALGIPEGDGFVNYTGTLFTDAFFSIQSYLHIDPQASFKGNQGQTYAWTQTWERLDVNQYDLIKQAGDYKLYRNDWTLPLAFPMKDQILDYPLRRMNPIQLQNELADLLIGDWQPESLFQQVAFSRITANLLETSGNGASRITFTKENVSEPGYLKILFTPQTDDPYYWVLDNGFKAEDAKILVNGQAYAYFPTFRQPAIQTLASKQQGIPQSLSFQISDMTFALKNPSIWALNREELKKRVAYVSAQGLQVSSWTSKSIQGRVETKEPAVMVTSLIYSPGWTVRVDGQTVPTYKVLDSLLAFKISPGDHQVTYSYLPPLWKEGILISLAAWSFLLGWALWHRKESRKLSS